MSSKGQSPGIRANIGIVYTNSNPNQALHVAVAVQRPQVSSVRTPFYKALEQQASQIEKPFNLFLNVICEEGENTGVTLG